jgi:hypothetical protein
LQSIESYAGGFAQSQIDQFQRLRTRAYFSRHVNCLAFQLRDLSFEYVKNAAKFPISPPKSGHSITKTCAPRLRRDGKVLQHH